MPQDRFDSHNRPKTNDIRSKALIAAGGNLPWSKGTPAQAIVEAAKLLRSELVCVTSVSRFYHTPCFPAGAGPDYVNVAVSLETDLSADALLAVLHDLEARFERKRINRWGMRTLDLDLLAYGDTICPDTATVQRWIGIEADAQMRHTPERLILPHPRIQDRAFVLVPLMDVAPDWRHPLLGQTVTQMHAALPEADRAGVTAL